MSVELWNNKPYLVVRWLLWMTVLGVAVVDWIVHRAVRTRGWQLHRSVVVVVILYFLKECVTLAWSNSDDFSATYFAVIFFYDLADAAFMCLLMVIASGWKITRDDLTGYKFGLVLGPMLFFFSDIVVDYIVEQEIGHDGIQTHKIKISSDTLRNILLFASALNAGALFYLWIWIFQSNKIERRKLEVKMLVQRNEIPIVVLRRAMGEVAAPTEAPPVYTEPAPDATRTSTASLSAVQMTSTDRLSRDVGDVPAQSTNPFAEPPLGAPPAYSAPATVPNLYTEVTMPTVGASGTAASQAPAVMQDFDAFGLHESTAPATDSEGEDDTPFGPTDANDQIPDMAKLRLLSQFNLTVSVYFFVVIGLLIWEVYQNRVLPPMVVVSDIAAILFMGSLAFIFRLRDKNPYFLLSDFAASAPAADGNVFRMGGSRDNLNATTATTNTTADADAHDRSGGNDGTFRFVQMRSNDEDEDDV
eukprot:Opistho-2@42968